MLLGENPERGMILPNEMNILLDFLMEAISYGTDSVAHISGPTMVNYVGKIMPAMNAMYQRLVDAGFDLPEQLKVKLIPAAGVRFVVGSDQRNQLDELLSGLSELDQVELSAARATKQLAAIVPKPPKAEFSELRAPAKNLAIQLVGKLAALPQLDFVASPESNNPVFTSQFTRFTHGCGRHSGERSICS
jgi:hypothetical protein